MPQTQRVLIEDGALPQVPAVFAELFPGRTPMVVADANTWTAAGEAVAGLLGSAERFILPGEPELPADMEQVELVQAALAGREVTPVAVGAGTINDLVKLAAGRLGRDYLVVGTAASMDGYTAFGASITEKGSKQTFDCPAPRGFVADLDVIAAAPRAMAATGYADLLAKVTAGADWILADALGIEPIDPAAWAIVQTPLRIWLSDPAGVARHDKPALKHLLEGLVAGGLAMQATKSSRPASGAEHQFSHLWDMQHHTHLGRHVPHGAKVGIGTLASARMYERLVDALRSGLDVHAAVQRWPTLEQLQAQVAALHDVPAIRDKAVAESTAKYISADQLNERLQGLERTRLALSARLREQLIETEALRHMLAAVGAPTEPEQIGITPERLRASHTQARTIRRRYTVLDTLHELGLE